MSKKKYYLPKKDADRVLWFDNFYQKLLLIYASLGLSALAMSNMLKDLNAYKYTLTFNASVKAFGKTLMAYKRAMNNGYSFGSAAAFPEYVAPPLPPDAVEPGIFNRVVGTVKGIKANTNFNETIGQNLNVIGADINPDYDTVKPNLKLSQSGGNVICKTPKKNTKAVRYSSKRANETEFTYLATITKGNLIDSRPNLVPGTPEVRDYQAWYLMDNEVVGLISNITSITV